MVNKMTNENKIIITLETDANGKLQITDKSVFDKIADGYHKLTATDYVGHFMDATADSLDMFLESKGVKGGLKVATSGQFTFLCLEQNYLEYLGEERSKYGDKGLRDHAVAFVKTTGNLAFGTVGSAVGAISLGTTGFVVGGIPGAVAGGARTGNALGATVVGVYTGTKTAVVTGYFGAMAGGQAGVITFDKVAWFGEGVDTKTIGDRLGDITKDGWDKAEQKLKDWLGIKADKFPHDVFPTGTSSDTINSVMFSKTKVSNEGKFDYYSFITDKENLGYNNYFSNMEDISKSQEGFTTGGVKNDKTELKTHTVSKGDTVWTIANNHGKTVSELLSVPGNEYQ
ncbi:hypothetical protein SZ25_00685, partial [Candidatus Arcanobacter lacustris]